MEIDLTTTEIPTDVRAIYSPSKLCDAVESMLETALWSTLGDDGDCLDSEYGVDDLSPEIASQAVSDVVELVGLAVEAGVGEQLAELDPEMVGHLFMLTRNHHGAGFWDRGMGDLGDALTDCSQSVGSFELYVGDDGELLLG